MMTILYSLFLPLVIVDGFSVLSHQKPSQHRQQNFQPCFFRRREDPTTINIEEFLDQGKSEIDEVVVGGGSVYGQAYHKGGSQKAPVVEPTKLHEEGLEDCDTPFVDFATGDELCWVGDEEYEEVASTMMLPSQESQPRRTKVPLEVSHKFKFQRVGPVAKSSHKGGSHNKPMMEPTKLSQQQGEECDEPFVDFATGDELCWPM